VVGGRQVERGEESAGVEAGDERGAAKLHCGGGGCGLGSGRPVISINMTAAESAKALKEKFPAAVTGETEFRGEQTVVVTAESLVAVMGWLRDEQAFDLLLDISSVDHLGQEPRFEMVYELYSIAAKMHLRVKVVVPEEEVATVSHIWPTADWHEREVYDMMGIRFAGHPDLRRILMWDGYPHYPLRKDFPLAGKSTDVPDVAFTGVAPLAGGPFVTSSGAADRVAAEPRAKGESGTGDRG
jgi:NADH-quinone oxidoreductase subunit C